jgi:hypothetical protein
VTLAQLQQALMTAWRLPALLVRLSDDNAPQGHSQVRIVQLAIRVARHSAEGWDNAALPDDLREIGELLLLAPDPTARLLREIDAD